MGSEGSSPKRPPVSQPVLYRVYRPAKGSTCILSQRRQAKKRAQQMMPRLRSGRQWTKYRKFVRRTKGIDFLKLPTYRVKE
jgi:hypothetical protein